MEESKILTLFFAREEQALDVAQQQYGSYCRYIAERILQNRSDAEEILNDTWLKAWETIPPKQPTHLRAYFGMLTRQLALNKRREQQAEKRGGSLPAALEELGDSFSDGEDFTDTVALREALERFLQKLPADTRRIFLRRYWYMSEISEIATDFSMKESTVAMRLLRTREKLREFLKQEDFIK